MQQYQERETDRIEGELLAPPATFHLPNGVYAAITEANLFNYHGAVLFGTAPNRVLSLLWWTMVGNYGSKHRMETATDAPGNRKLIEVKKSKICSGQQVKEELMSGGGFVARISKQ